MPITPTIPEYSDGPAFQVMKPQGSRISWGRVWTLCDTAVTVTRKRVSALRQCRWTRRKAFLVEGRNEPSCAHLLISSPSTSTQVIPFNSSTTDCFSCFLSIVSNLQTLIYKILPHPPSYYPNQNASHPHTALPATRDHRPRLTHCSPPFCRPLAALLPGLGIDHPGAYP